MSDVALANEPEVRTPTGEIKDQTQAPTSTPTPTTTETKSEDKPSLLNEKPTEEKKPDGAPEKYEFKYPEGYEMSEDVFKSTSDLFKKHNISQAAAQELVDYVHKVNQDAAEAPYKLWQKTQEEWVTAAKNDPEIGGRLNEVKTVVSKAIDFVVGKTLGDEFRQAMDMTGAGNNPAFIKTFYALAQRITEGGHVSGTGPSKFGQTAPGTAERPSAAKAMYPNLS